MQVWSALPQGGGICDFVVLEGSSVSKKPKTTAVAPAADVGALPYVGLSALQWARKAEIAFKGRILLTGATCPAGLVFLQVLKRNTSEVTALCSPSRTATLAAAMGAAAAAAYDHNPAAVADDGDPEAVDSDGDLKAATAAAQEDNEAAAAAELMLAGAEPATFSIAVAADPHLVSLAFIRRYLRPGGLLIHESLTAVKSRDLDSLRSFVENNGLRPALDGQFKVTNLDKAVATLTNVNSAIFGHVVITMDN